MTYHNQGVQKTYYSIGEVAKMFQVSTSLIRFWEGEFAILKPRKNSKGNRLFTRKDVDNLHLIYHLVKERGYTLEGAKRKLRENKDETNNDLEMLKTLKRLRTFLVDLRDGLDG